MNEVRGLWGQNFPDEDWVIRFLKAVGSNPDALPRELITAAVPLVPVLRHGRPIWEGDLPLAELAAATFPKLVVSGGHSAGSTRSATILLNALAHRGRWPAARATRSSSPDDL